VNGDAGVIVASDTDGLLPLPEEITTLTSVTYMQFLAPWAPWSAARWSPSTATRTPSRAGAATRSSRTSPWCSIPSACAVPYSALGGELLLVLPEQLGTFTVAALDATGRPDESGFDDAFQNGTVISEELRVGYKPFGLSGHLDLSGASRRATSRFSTRTRGSS